MDRATGGHRGERRQLYARDRRLGPEAPLVFIAPGQAEVLREDCRAGHLICPVPGCPDPRYTTRGGARRDHFVHVRAPTDPNHQPERYSHWVGKHLIGDWLRGQPGVRRVQIDREPVESGQVPDVLVDLDDGRRLAFELQYSPLALGDWSRRHEGYLAQGIVDCWLLGHLPPHLSAAPRSRGEGWFALNALAEAIYSAGLPLRWLDPDERTVLSLRRETLHRLSGATRRYGAVARDRLQDCRLEEGRLVTPADDRAAASRARGLARTQPHRT